MNKLEDSICVENLKNSDKKAALLEIYRHVHKYLRRKGKYNSLLIYPEGRHGGMNEYILPFKPGAFSALAPIKFINMKYYYDPITKVYPSNFRSVIEEYLMAISRCWLIIELDYSETMYPDHQIDYNLPYDEMIEEIESNLDQYKQWSQEYMQKVSENVNEITSVEFLPSFKEMDKGEAKEFWLWVYTNQLHEIHDLEDKSKVIELVRQWVKEGHRDTYLEKHNPSTYRGKEQILNELGMSE